MTPQTNKENPGLKYFENLKNDWSVIKTNLLEKFKELREEDLNYEEGKEDELLKRMEKKLVKTREEVERILQDIYLSAPKGGSPK
ncbi:MAG: hypothetical protein SH857_06750 [Chitinophagales bacterium]|nr:hypothetical protein [Chitinophagales bacterium]